MIQIYGADSRQKRFVVGCRIKHGKERSRSAWIAGNGRRIEAGERLRDMSSA